MVKLCLGGGSALLPAPVPPISLQEKLDVTRKLAAAGATIQELNTVRRALSFLKGGGLAQCAHPAQVTYFSLKPLLKLRTHSSVILLISLLFNHFFTGHCTDIV